MRLILAAIFCSALLSDLLNMKRFALQGDAGKGNLPGAHRPLPPHPPPFLCMTQGGWGAVFLSSTRVPRSCVQVSNTVTGITTVS